MSELLERMSATSLMSEGHYGPAGASGVTARLIEGLAAATLVARKGATGPLVSRFAATGLTLADAPKVSAANGLELIGTGPGRWIVFAEGMTGAALLGRLHETTAGLAALTDQSDANLIFEIAGPKVREALAKGVSVDLHEAAFGPGDAATTSVALRGVTLWQCDGTPIYRFAVARSFAPAFLRWLTASAVEYGFTLSGTGRG